MNFDCNNLKKEKKESKIINAKQLLFWTTNRMWRVVNLATFIKT